MSYKFDFKLVHLLRRFIILYHKPMWGMIMRSGERINLIVILFHACIFIAATPILLSVLVYLIESTPTVDQICMFCIDNDSWTIVTRA